MFTRACAPCMPLLPSLSLPLSLSLSFSLSLSHTHTHILWWCVCVCVSTYTFISLCIVNLLFPSSSSSSSVLLLLLLPTSLPPATTILQSFQGPLERRTLLRVCPCTVGRRCCNHSYKAHGGTAQVSRSSDSVQRTGASWI